MGEYSKKYVQKHKLKIFFKKVLTKFFHRVILYYVGADDVKGTPVPISNTVVKLGDAEDTWLVTTWENRKVPTFLFFFFESAFLSGFYFLK